MNELTNFANPIAKPETFDQIQIGIASPGAHPLAGRSARSRSPRRSTIARSSPSVTACSARASSVRSRTTSACAASTSA